MQVPGLTLSRTDEIVSANEASDEITSRDFVNDHDYAGIRSRRSCFQVARSNRAWTPVFIQRRCVGTNPEKWGPKSCRKWGQSGKNFCSVMKLRIVVLAD